MIKVHFNTKKRIKQIQHISSIYLNKPKYLNSANLRQVQRIFKRNAIPIPSKINNYIHKQQTKSKTPCFKQNTKQKIYRQISARIQRSKRKLNLSLQQTININQSQIIPKPAQTLKLSTNFKQITKKRRLYSTVKKQQNQIQFKKFIKFKNCYSQKIKQQATLKGTGMNFSFKSKDTFVSDVLIASGWKLSKNPYQQCDFKWSFKYDNKINKGKVQNHFKNTEPLTTKLGLHKQLRDYSQVGYKYNQISPATYEIPKEQQQLQQQYYMLSFWIILKKHMQYLKQHYEMILNNIDYDGFILIDWLQQNRYVQKQKSKQFPYFKVSMLVQTVLYLQQIRRNKQGLEKLPIVYQDLLNNKQAKNNLLSFSHQEVQNLYTLYKPNIKSANNSRDLLRFNYTIQKPSLQLIIAIAYLYNYFYFNIPCYNKESQYNLWIVKPLTGSRGIGITITNSLQTILNLKNRLVQKYIQNPWILKHELDCQSSKLIKNKKFDLRFWVLITSTNPLCAYVFNKCYGRVCPKQYKVQEFNDLKSHLTNYSLNHKQYIKGSYSIISDDNLQQIIRQVQGISFNDQIKPIVNLIIKKSVQITCAKIQSSINQFELIGFDFILDNNLKPWLLQANLSPACQSQRDPWLEITAKQMAAQIIRMYYPDKIQMSQKQGYQWLQLINEKPYKERFINQLQCIGRHINTSSILRLQQYIKQRQIKLQKFQDFYL